MQYDINIDSVFKGNKFKINIKENSLKIHYELGSYYFVPKLGQKNILLNINPYISLQSDASIQNQELTLGQTSLINNNLIFAVN